MSIPRLTSKSNTIKPRLQTLVSSKPRSSTVVVPPTTPKCSQVPKRFSTSNQLNHKTALLFPGQGSQYVGMGKDFYNQYACAREVFDEVDDTLGYKLSNLMFEGDQKVLRQTEHAQPAIMATSIASLRVLQKEFDFNLKTDAHYALGHSLGEYTALVAAEALPLRDAVKLVYQRGIAMQECTQSLPQRTVMCALTLKKSSLKQLIDAMNIIKQILPPGEVAELANVNSSHQVVLSGTVEGVNEASRYLKDHHIAFRSVDLPVSAPFHSSLMSPVCSTVDASLRSTEFHAPIIPVLFNASGQTLNPDTLNFAEVIRQNILQQIDRSVPWYNSIQFCKSSGVSQFITLGPSKVLGNLVRKDYPLDWIRYAGTVDNCHKEFYTRSSSEATATDSPSPDLSLEATTTTTPLPKPSSPATFFALAGLSTA